MSAGHARKGIVKKPTAQDLTEELVLFMDCRIAAKPFTMFSRPAKGESTKFANFTTKQPIMTCNYFGHPRTGSNP
jgi:hypothetical protein